MKIGIIGFGYLGESLVNWHLENKCLDFVVIRNVEKHDFQIKQIGNKAKVLNKISDITEFADINIIAVPDSEIINVLNEISIHNSNINSKIFVHCSGVFRLNILETLLDKGALIAAAHPYQTFWSKKSSNLDFIPWLVESNNCFDEIKNWIVKMNGSVIDYNEMSNNSEIDKRGYHLSAVIASNYMNTLFYLSKNVAKKSGINPQDFIPQISKTTLENNINNLTGDNSFPLTGPVARGDYEAIKMHLDFLKNHIELINPYIYMSLATIEIAKQNQILDDLKYKSIKDLLLNNII